MNSNRKSLISSTAFLTFIVTLCAILPVLISCSGKLYLVGDYMTQQIPFMKESRRVILSGTPFWSANTFFGANFIGTYSFYVYGSPFFWPLLLVPERYMGYGLAVTFILKHIVAALTAKLYLSNHTKISNLATVGALLYAFSGYTIDSTYYYHFLDVIAFFPLILYCTDKVLDNAKKPLLSLSAFVCAITNYYFFVGTSFLFLFYLGFRIKFSNKKYNYRDAIRCILLYGLGGLASAFILIPSLLCLLETSKATNSWNTSLLSSLLTIPQSIKFLEGIVLPSEGILASGTGFNFSAFTSTAAFLPIFGAFFFFIALSRSKTEKTWDYKLLKFMLILTFIPFGNGIFSLFTNMSYTRWWYGFVLISIVCALHIIEDTETTPLTKAECKKSAKRIRVIALTITLTPIILKILVAYLLRNFLTSIFPKQYLKYLYSSGLLDSFTSTDIRYLVVLVFLTTLSYGTLYLVLKKELLLTKKMIPILCIVCAITYGIYLFNETTTYKEVSPQSFVENNEEVTSAATEYDSRVQNIKHLQNYSMISNEPSIYTFHSFKSHSTSNFCRIVGYEITSAPSTNCYYNTEAIQTVLNIKTIVNQDNSRANAPYYSPMGYVYNEYIIDDCKFTKDISKNNARIELMTKACYLDSETANELSAVVKTYNAANDTTTWQEASKERAVSACNDFCLNTSGFTATSTGDSTRLIYFSIPNDSGWIAYVNGTESKIYTVNGGMMGIVVPEGTSQIEFKFVPPGLYLGISISLFAFLVIIIYAILGKYSVNIKLRKN